ncbi:hypothetical protein CKO31_22975 [Thiohalocapsa halophila]|uniref:Uncharacterized protein n=1 Tax=Thiohalocapsa halophila TaxID=69359 RepID=A0ABS1CNQ3_9GAMM|nr:hypothetical protein [Thiohalocapsa halophila]MBK1633555.1 hypothetical protein [Thiohalocapsa halophila]
MIRRALLAVAVRRDTGELRPWALVLLALRRRQRAWWYQLALPRLLHARARWRRWCRVSRLGRLLCWPFPPWLLALVQYLGLVAVIAAALALLLLAERLYCAHAVGPPACEDRCLRRARRVGSLPPAALAVLRRECFPWPWEVEHGR